MALLQLSAQAPAEEQDSNAGGAEHGDRITDQLFAEIEHLRRERDCLRSALVDAGFSLRVERIACYADEASPQCLDLGLITRVRSVRLRAR